MCVCVFVRVYIFTHTHTHTGEDNWYLWKHPTVVDMLASAYVSQHALSTSDYEMQGMPMSTKTLVFQSIMGIIDECG